MKVKTCLPYITCVMLLSLLMSYGCGEKAIKLHFLFNEGDELKYNITLDSTTATEFMGKKMEMPSKTEIVLTKKVKESDQEASKLDITYDSFDMEMNVGGKKVPSNMGKSMAGKTYSMKIARNGEILEPKGMNAMVGLQGLGSDVKNIFFSLYPKFPDHELKVGESWTQKQDLSHPQVGTLIECTYTLTKMEQKGDFNCAVIDYTLSINIEGGEEAKMSMSGTGTGKGTSYFAFEKGLLVSSQVEMDITMSIAAPLPTGNQEIPTTTHQKIELSLI